MKGLTLTQPWATLIAIGAKQVETRSRRTWHRGRLAIHAAKGFTSDDVMAANRPDFVEKLAPGAPPWHEPGVWSTLPLGAVVAVATIINCVPTERYRPSESERPFGNYERGRYCWLLKDIVQLPQPVPCRGALGLWDVPADVELAIEQQLVAVPS